MTKLEACSEVLRAVGRQGVSTLDTGGGSEASRAERVLDSMTLQVQTDAWYYNRRFRVTLSPDTDGHINMPTGAIVADMDNPWTARPQFTQLGDRLFDVTNNTDVFTASVRVEYSLRYDFDCIPQPIQKLIVRLSCERYSEEFGGSAQEKQARRSALMGETYRARVAANRYNDRASGVNVLHNSEEELIRGVRFQSVR